MSEILNQLQEVKLAAQAQTEASQAQTTEVANKMGHIDQTLQQAKQSFDAWKEETKAEDIQGQGRYVTELFVDGDKDTFYPVCFKMHSGEETTIQIYREYSWNSKKNTSEDIDRPSDFNDTHVAAALVVLKGQDYPWSGNANYLRTVVNRQRYRQCVAKVGFYAWCEAQKRDSDGPDSMYNKSKVGYEARTRSGFMLRGGKLRYQIFSNRPIKFYLYQTDGEEIYSRSGRENVTWLSKTVSLAEAEAGDSKNNVPLTYTSYDNAQLAPSSLEAMQSRDK
ncbi:hypothetical protein GTG28_17980 [Vibrio sp. OCN044]|uniref:Uncharacterized protein n=1 Tax=Vibrio tetraodonis subsp. pristinus TaxID=2695891 RepID=A0A6L8LYC2_9VIBR|nr:hypothetical protein [Vibrio tetraodonis]MYM61121.1 hypothetical protein [Vibrio tetraodonis subsp. pristinus]